MPSLVLFRAGTGTESPRRTERWAVLIKRASQKEGNGLNVHELQCSMMHKVNHECVLLSGSSVGLPAPSSELFTHCLSQVFHSRYLRPQKKMLLLMWKHILKAVCCWRRGRIKAFHSVLWALQDFSRFTRLLRVIPSQTRADSATLRDIQAWASSNLRATYSHQHGGESKWMSLFPGVCLGLCSMLK